MAVTLPQVLDDKTVRIWDAKTGVHLTTLKGHSNWVTSVAFSPDGSHIASGSGDKTVRIWDAKTGVHLNTLKGHSDWVTSVAFSPDGSYIYVSIWAVRPNTFGMPRQASKSRTLPLPSPLTFAALIPFS